MKKDIVCVKFKKECDYETANRVMTSVREHLQGDYYTIGVFEPTADVIAVTPDTKILYIDGEAYSAEELADIIDKAARYDDLCD